MLQYKAYEDLEFFGLDSQRQLSRESIREEEKKKKERREEEEKEKRRERGYRFCFSVRRGQEQEGKCVLPFLV